MSDASKNKMKLGEFISQTLIEIINGISTAQNYAFENGADINPKNINWSDSKKGYHSNLTPTEDTNPLLSPIDFEILVTIGEDDSAQGGFGIFAAALGVGIKGEVKEYSESVNKIKFQILAKLPQQHRHSKNISNK